MSATTPQASGRTCVWCEGTPLTAEHAWPQWIAKYVPEALTSEKADHYYVSESAEGRTVEHRGRRYPFTSEAKCVCKPCNEGWMHELETTAEYTLAPLIEGQLTTRSGEPWRFHEWRQAIAATWAFKTAMMLEHLDSKDKRTISSRIYPMFRAFLRPTTMTAVWMAHYTGDEPHHFGHGQLMAQVIGPEGPIEPQEAQPYAGVLSVGQLAFWYVGHLVQGADIYGPRDDLAGRIVRIWPITPTAEWPPAESIDDEGLRGLMFSLADSFEPPGA